MLVYEVLCDGGWSDCFVLFSVVVFVCVSCGLMRLVFVMFCAMRYDCCACPVMWVSACVMFV